MKKKPTIKSLKKKAWSLVSQVSSGPEVHAVRERTGEFDLWAAQLYGAHLQQGCEGVAPEVKRRGRKPKTGAYVPCAHCGELAWTHKSRAATYKLRFCSKEHNIAYMKAHAHRLNCVVCGVEFFCQPIQVKLRNRRTCSIACRSVMQTREAERRALTNPPTKGALNRRIRYSKRMSMWRVAVFERDNYTCQSCGKRGGYLEADHIKPFARFPELRFELANGRTLCRPCHISTDTWGYKTREQKEKTTDAALAEG